jgi:hypothetical protein
VEVGHGADASERCRHAGAPADEGLPDRLRAVDLRGGLTEGVRSLEIFDRVRRVMATATA